VELADTGVWARKDHPSLEPWFSVAMEAGDIAMCDIVALEILHSARSGREFDAMEVRLRRVPWITIESADWARARAVYRSLAWQAGGQQRQVPHPDILIAACAERQGVTVVHYDADYDLIGAVTGQPMRWVAPRGSL
jgi:predicted nucleic acid-binding protein